MDRLSVGGDGAGGPRRLTVEEMQAALAAAWRGDFTGSATPGPAASPERVGSWPAGDAGLMPAGTATERRPTLVLAAHAGAGASTVAVALADGLASAGEEVRLVEAADPRRAGLVEASGVELGEAAGWRRGRRAAGAGQVLVERLVEPVDAVGDVLAPHSSGASLLVVDAGWPAWEVIGAGGWMAAALASARLVVVCRPTVPGLRQAERLLAELPAADQVVMACVGSVRWSRLASAGCGPLLAEARGTGRMVAVPVHPALAVSGVTADPLPRPVAMAGQVLAGLVADGTASGRADRAHGVAR